MPRLLITMTLLGTVGAVATKQGPRPDAAKAEEPEPEWARREREERLRFPQDVEARTARASEHYEASREKVRTAYQQVIEDFEEARDRGGLDAALRESARVRSLHAFLLELRKLGEKVIADEATFKAAFEQFQGAGAAAAFNYRDSAELFRRHAARAEFPETKGTYQKAADWYEARAKRAKLEASLKFPTDYETEQRRLKEFVESLRVLEETVRRDPASFREPPKGLDDLVAFESYYRKLGEVLQKNTNQILEGLPSEPRSPQ